MSLWLVPVTAQMDAIKSSLPRRPSTGRPLSPSSYPTILPHITLATVPFSDSRVSGALLDAVPKNQTPIDINFQSLVVGDHYFRSVLIDIQLTQELADFQNQILTNLRHRGFEPSAPRFPHMSLCYIADEDESERDRVIQMLRDTGVVSQMPNAQLIMLQCNDVSLTGFSGTEIWSVKCEGHVETWEISEKVTLES